MQGTVERTLPEVLRITTLLVNGGLHMTDDLGLLCQRAIRMVKSDWLSERDIVCP